MSEDEGLLSQDEINAALAEAGLEPDILADEPATATTAPEAPAAVVDTRVDATGRPFDEVAAAMAEAIENERRAAAPAVSTATMPLPSGAAPFEIPELSDRPSVGPLNDGIDLLRDVELNVKIELGRSRMLVDDVLRLGEGSVVELDKLAGDPVDVYVNDRLVARGEVLVLNDNFCVRINDIVKQEAEEEN
jgi:flagellar motor switch protein FliN/FliY